eukprot:TRINITY_DN2012_c0_g1_i1.p1 TRINITY_DN2012_c0_g1~~TRINITY_DN2012_c0_g1_i1.p1  ORF type:complete len:948 (-),score=205.72 TRINITY_DN2012_c0_g1_i1:135-2978(-)
MSNPDRELNRSLTVQPSSKSSPSLPSTSDIVEYSHPMLIRASKSIQLASKLLQTFAKVVELVERSTKSVSIAGESLKIIYEEEGLALDAIEGYNHLLSQYENCRTQILSLKYLLEKRDFPELKQKSDNATSDKLEEPTSEVEISSAVVNSSESVNTPTISNTPNKIVLGRTDNKMVTVPSGFATPRATIAIMNPSKNSDNKVESKENPRNTFHLGQKSSSLADSSEAKKEPIVTPNQTPTPSPQTNETQVSVNDEEANKAAKSKTVSPVKERFEDADFSEKLKLKIIVKVKIPIIGMHYETSFLGSTSIKQIKIELLKKVGSSGVKNTNPTSYYISHIGLRVLDEQISLLSLFYNNSSEREIELVRPPEFEINLADIKLPTPFIVSEAMQVSAVAKKLARLCFPGAKANNKNYHLMGGRFKEPEKLDPDASFFSYGFRGMDKLHLVLEAPEGSKEGDITEDLVIEYSPFDGIDREKDILSRKGYLKKQGGSKGGTKSWLKRWFELENNQLAYYTDDKAKVLKGVIQMVGFLSVDEVTDKKLKPADNYQYFLITTVERAVLLGTKTREDMVIWIDCIRKYANLIRLEQSYNIKIYTPEDTMNDAKRIQSPAFRRRKDDQQSTTTTISAPFLARKVISVNTDFQWSSQENPIETFEFLEQIGVGAMGVVVKAAHKKLNGLVIAIKIVEGGNKKLQEDLEKEMEILKQCRSENVIAYFGTIIRENETWILMDYCAVGSVKDVIKTTMETLNEPQCKYILLGTLKGLAYMHQRKILHLDVKAANILLTDQGTVKLADFGVSQVLKTNEMIEKQDDYVGSPLFMAPEVIRKEGYGTQADIWSLGITIIEMTQGRPPNTDINCIEKLPQLAEREPPKFPVPSKYSPGFNEFLSTCLTKDVSKRPSAIDLLTHPFMRDVPGPDVLRELIYQCLSLQKRKKINSVSEVVPPKLPS